MTNLLVMIFPKQIILFSSFYYWLGKLQFFLKCTDLEIHKN